MLVLGRKEGQQILLDNKVVIKVVSVQGNYVKVGIEAPKDIKVYREEVCPTDILLSVMSGQ